MSKHGTASVSGLFVELMKAVMSALPRNLPEDIAEEWTKNGAALKRALQQALMPPSGERVVMSALDVAIAGIVRTLHQFFLKKGLYALSIPEFSYRVRYEERQSGGWRRVWVELTIPSWWSAPYHISLRLDESDGSGWLLSDNVGILLHPKMQMPGFLLIRIHDIPMIESAHRFVQRNDEKFPLLETLNNTVRTL